MDKIKFEDKELHSRFMEVTVKNFRDIDNISVNTSVIRDHWDTFQEGAEESVYCHETLESAMEPLVQFLKESKGWLRDYSSAIILDAIDRKQPEVPALHVERLKRKLSKRDKKIEGLKKEISDLNATVASLSKDAVLVSRKDLQRDMQYVMSNMRMIPALGIGASGKILEIDVKDKK